MYVYVCVYMAHNIFLENNFSNLHSNALYQPSDLTAMDMLREHSFIISNTIILLPQLVLLIVVLLKKEKLTLTLP